MNYLFPLSVTVEHYFNSRLVMFHTYSEATFHLAQQRLNQYIDILKFKKFQYPHSVLLNTVRSRQTLVNNIAYDTY